VLVESFTNTTRLGRMGAKLRYWFWEDLFPRNIFYWSSFFVFILLVKQV